MVLSNTCKYAIRAIIYLSLHGDENKRIGIKQISKELDMPSPFLGKIFQTLARQKLLNSTKGPHGGFSLAKPADDIKLLDIVEIIDGLDTFNSCLFGMEICQKDGCDTSLCPIHPYSDPVRQDLYRLFKNLTIGKISKDFNASGIAKFL